jgi:hypothetical protein
MIRRLLSNKLKNAWRGCLPVAEIRTWLLLVASEKRNAWGSVIIVPGRAWSADFEVWAVIVMTFNPDLKSTTEISCRKTLQLVTSGRVWKERKGVRLDCSMLRYMFQTGKDNCYLESACDFKTFSSGWSYLLIGWRGAACVVHKSRFVP